MSTVFTDNNFVRGANTDNNNRFTIEVKIWSSQVFTQNWLFKTPSCLSYFDFNALRLSQEIEDLASGISGFCSDVNFEENINPAFVRTQFRTLHRKSLLTWGTQIDEDVAFPSAAESGRTTVHLYAFPSLKLYLTRFSLLL